MIYCTVIVVYIKVILLPQILVDCYALLKNKMIELKSSEQGR